MSGTPDVRVACIVPIIPVRTANVRVACIVPIIPVPTVCSGFTGTDVSLGLTDVSLGLMCGLCQLPERRAICRSTKLKCCDRLPDAVSCDATICVIRDEEPGSSDAVCRQNALPMSCGSSKRCQAATFPASPDVTARGRLTVCTAVSSLQKQ